MTFLKNAKKYLGAIEGSNKHKEIIDGYNKIKPLPQGYKVKYTDQWCATFVSYIASISNFLMSVVCRECGRKRRKTSKPQQHLKRVI